MDEPVPPRAPRRLCCEKRASYDRTVAGAVAKQAAAEKNTEKTNAANGVNFWELKGFIQNENEKNIDHQIKIGLDQNFQNVVG